MESDSSDSDFCLLFKRFIIPVGEAKVCLDENIFPFSSWFPIFYPNNASICVCQVYLWLVITFRMQLLSRRGFGFFFTLQELYFNWTDLSLSDIKTYLMISLTKTTKNVYKVIAVVIILSFNDLHCYQTKTEPAFSSLLELVMYCALQHV